MQLVGVGGTEIVLGLLLAAVAGAAIGFLARGWYDARLRKRRRRVVAELRSAARERTGGAALKPASPPSSPAVTTYTTRPARTANASQKAAASSASTASAHENSRAAAKAGRVVRSAGAAEQGTASQGALVLLVDDRLELLALHSAYLHRAGYRVLTAGDGDTALESAREHHPAVIVLDHSMPKRTGVEVARELKSDPGTADIPILLMTAHSYGAIGPSALAAGCAAFLPKPCEPSRLLREVARHAPAMSGGSA